MSRQSRHRRALNGQSSGRAAHLGGPLGQAVAALVLDGVVAGREALCKHRQIPPSEGASEQPPCSPGREPAAARFPKPPCVLRCAKGLRPPCSTAACSPSSLCGVTHRCCRQGGDAQPGRSGTGASAMLHRQLPRSRAQPMTCQAVHARRHPVRVQVTAGAATGPAGRRPRPPPKESR